MSDIPALLIAVPLLGSVTVFLAGLARSRTGWPIAVVTAVVQTGMAVALAVSAFGDQPIRYVVGGFTAPFVCGARNLGEALRRIDELATRILKRHLRALRDRPLTQEIMRWELLERSDFTDRLAEAREQAGLELVARMAAASDEELLSGRRAEQFASVAALLHAGISYLVLRSKTADRYIGIDLSTPDGWRSVESAIEILVRSYFTHTHSEKGDEDE